MAAPTSRTDTLSCRPSRPDRVDLRRSCVIERWPAAFGQETSFALGTDLTIGCRIRINYQPLAYR
ncbi:hypothetical protein DO73_1458 [Burkholderia pseudomallei]|nr:hypothetical protein DO73_1458 [Burkholderia pseudomallei]